MNWERLVLGRRSDAFGSARWPILAVAGVLIAIWSVTSGDWLYTTIGPAVALIGGAMTIGMVAR